MGIIMEKTVITHVVDFTIMNNTNHKHTIVFACKRKPIIEWCKNNCSGQWTEYLGSFYFEREQDLMLFKLRWV
jgi:hypothetical protein